jgi:hypothetical protein
MSESQVSTTKPREEKSCSVEKCKRPYKAHGYCVAHYRKWRQGEMPKSRYKTCSKEGCFKKRAPGKGSLCAEHAAGGEAAAS